MNVSLTPALDKFVHDKVKSGRYNSASEVVREAIRIMQDHENSNVIHAIELRRKIEEGLVDLARGRFTDGTIDELKDATLKRARSRVTASKKTSK
jgi:antitoxin ParD1/3/4